jgi:hypothetical protein
MPIIAFATVSASTPNSAASAPGCLTPELFVHRLTSVWPSFLFCKYFQLYEFTDSTKMKLLQNFHGAL